MTFTAIETVPTQPDGRHRWRIIAVAAAAVVAIVVGGLVVVARDDSQPGPADTPVAPGVSTADEEIARGFLDAYIANDADRALNYITDSAIAAAAIWGSADEFRGDIAWNEATGFKMMINNCAPHDDDPEAGITVRCGFDFYMLGSDGLGNGPYRDNYWDLTIRDGQVVSAEKRTPASNGWAAGWTDFQRWIKGEHRDDLPVLYDGDYFGSRRFTADALQLWEQRTQEYMQAVLPRLEAYSADVAAICATRAPQLSELAWPTDQALDQAATEYTATAAVLSQTYDELAALSQTHEGPGPLDAPRSIDMTGYAWFREQFGRLGEIAEKSAAAATAGDSTRLAELNTEYQELRQTMTGRQAGSALQECIASLPS